MDFEGLELALAKEELVKLNKEIVLASASLDGQLDAFYSADGSSIRKAQLMHLVKTYIAPQVWVTKSEKMSVTESLSFKRANYQLQHVTKSLINAYERKIRAEYKREHLIERIKLMELPEEEGE